METPKYVIVQEWIKSEINKGTYKDGDKMLSENELMEKFNFSRQTIRLAISKLENEGFLEKIKGSGTYIKIRNNNFIKETRNIGVIITYLDEYIFPEIIKGIENVLSNNNYNITLGITYNKVEKETSILNSMVNKKVDGIIVEGTKSAIPNPNKEIYEQFKKTIPCVFINGCYPDLDIPLCAMNDVEGGYTATKYLIDHGHKKIGACFKSDDMPGHKRYEGFMNAMHRQAIPVNEKNIHWYTTEDLEYMFKGDADSILLRRFEGCTAIICYNDQMALNMIRFMERNNIKPFEDISIIGFDNSTLSKFLDLTSVNHAKYNLGELAAESLIKQIKTGERSDIKLKAEIVERSSVRTLKDNNDIPLYKI